MAFTAYSMKPSSFHFRVEFEFTEIQGELKNIVLLVSFVCVSRAVVSKQKDTESDCIILEFNG